MVSPRNSVAAASAFAVATLCILVVSGSASPTFALEVVEAEHQAEPLHRLSVGWVDAVQVGLNVAGTTVPQARAMATAITIEKEALEVLQQSVAGRTTKLEGDLLLIDEDAKRLTELWAQGKNLRTDPDAQDVLERLRGRVTAPDDSEYTFAARALFSRHGLYATATVAGRYWVTDRLGKSITKTLGVGPFTADSIRGSRWGRLKKISRLTQSLSDELTKAFLKKVARAVFDEVLAEKIREIERNIANYSPSGGGRRGYAHRLRLEMVRVPQFVLPVLAAAPAAAVASDRVLVMPERLEVYREPVVNSIAVERQVIDRQNFTVETSRETVREAPVSHPMRETQRVSSFDPSSHFRGGFDSSGGSLWGRY